MNDTKQSVSEKSPEYLAATLREVAEMLEDVGKTIDARLGAWRADKPGTATEPEPPCVELPIYSGRCNITYTRINEFSLCDTDECNVDGVGTWPGGQPTGTDSYRMKGSAFSIWQECQRKRVPCPEPPSVTLHGPHTGNPYRYARIDTMHTVSDGTALTGWWAGNDAAWNTCDVISHVVAESPAAIRAACDEKGVPCVGEEPKTVDIISANTGGIVHLRDLRPIEALIDPEHGPCLRVNGYVTKAPLADIIAQAAAAGIELPPVTVHDGEGGEWLEITAIDAFQRPEDDNVRSEICGKEVKLGRYSLCTDNTTPGQLLALCKLAGWPKPEVRCEFHHCDGTAREVDPARVTSVSTFRTTATRETRVWMGDEDWLVVREPVPVVQRMIGACKEQPAPSQ